MERADIAITPRDPYVIAMARLTEPFAQARDDYEIFAGIARAMDVAEAFTEGLSAADWQRQIYDQTINRAHKDGIEMPEYDRFLDKGWFKLADPARPTVMLEDFRADPAANPLTTPSGSIVVDPAMRPAVVQMSTGTWYDPDETGLCKHGNPNVLTRDKGTSKLGQGPSAHSCLIEVELFTGPAPSVTAHAPPTILRPCPDNDRMEKT
jgi:anaerobic selenocysteine-containing dehydrogenase